MTFTSATVQKRIGCLAIVALALWLGGFGCSLCCVTGATDSCCLSSHEAVSQPTPPAQAAPACGPAVRSCCQRSKGDGQAARSTTLIQDGGAVGCSLLPNCLEGVTAPVRVAGALAAQGELSAPLFVLHGPVRTAPLREPPPPLNRGGTFLRCGALLI